MKDRYVIEYQAPGGGWYRFRDTTFTTKKLAIEAIPLLRANWKAFRLLGGKPRGYQVMYNGERVHKAGG